MTESIQKILKQRALGEQNPTQPQQIIDWFEAVAKVWNQHATPFEWGRKRAQPRQQAHLRKRYRLAASAACVRYPIRRRLSSFEKWRCA